MACAMLPNPMNPMRAVLASIASPLPCCSRCPRFALQMILRHRHVQRVTKRACGEGVARRATTFALAQKMCHRVVLPVVQKGHRASAQAMPFAIRRAGSLKWLPGFCSKTVGTPLASNSSTTSRVPCATLRKSLLGVRASLLPSEKYAQAGLRANSFAAA